MQNTPHALSVISDFSSVISDFSRSPQALLRQAPVRDVRFSDAFWQPRRRANAEITLPSQYRHLEDTGAVDNFRRAAGLKDVPFQGMVFSDSDVYKWLEAACWALAHPHPNLLDTLVADTAALVAKAQQPDGYLHTYFVGDKTPERWATLSSGPNNQHELYCAGHFFQAAIAHHRVVGSTLLLDVALRFADHICETFGPRETQRHGTDGHPEIEMPLVELFRITQDAKYLRQAQYFVDVRRGMGRINDAEQVLLPFRELTRMGGHAVCAVYLCAGVADIYAETGEAALKQTLDTLWDNMADTQTYVTGGIGSRWGVESFGDDYELPAHAYAETCAAIGSVMWQARMLALSGAAKYADALEQTLYNGLLAGLSLDDTHYFYQNPLAAKEDYRRRPWFGCACCPPNVARLLAQLPGYQYSVADNAAWAHLYITGTADLTLPDSRTVSITQQTQYPYDGDITLSINGTGVFTLHLRIPAWAEGALLAVNGQPVRVTPGTYAALARAWQPGDTVFLSLPLPVRRVRAHPRVADSAGRVALQRGPLVYCLEGADQPHTDIRDIRLPQNAIITTRAAPDLPSGVVALEFTGTQADPHALAHTPYQTDEARRAVPQTPVSVTAIPYYAWANRAPGRLLVWIPTEGT